MGIMKAKIILFLLLLSSVAFAQYTSLYSYDIQLNTTDSIDTYQWLKNYPFSQQDQQIINKYTNSICNGIRTYISNEEMPNADIEKVVKYNLNNAYYHTLSGVIYQSYKYYNMLHLKIKNKNFRDFLFNKACDILCDLVSIYPRDFQVNMEELIESTLEFMTDIPNHTYEIKEDLQYSWRPLTIFVDGQPDHNIAFTLNGFLIRRMIIDNVSYDEVLSKLQTLLQKISDIEHDNPDFAYSYVINNEIIYYIGCFMNYFKSLEYDEYYVPYVDSREMVVAPNVIKCRQNFGQNFYIISNRLWTDSEYTHTVVDKYMNIIYQE